MAVVMMASRAIGTPHQDYDEESNWLAVEAGVTSAGATRSRFVVPVGGWYVAPFGVDRQYATRHS